jgi:hypothetical protein
VRWLTEILAFVIELVILVAAPLLLAAAAFAIEFVLQWTGLAPPLR